MYSIRSDVVLQCVLGFVIFSFYVSLLCMEPVQSVSRLMPCDNWDRLQPLRNLKSWISRREWMKKLFWLLTLQIGVSRWAQTKRVAWHALCRMTHKGLMLVDRIPVPWTGILSTICAYVQTTVQSIWPSLSIWSGCWPDLNPSEYLAVGKLQQFLKDQHQQPNHIQSHSQMLINNEEAS